MRKTFTTALLLAATNAVKLIPLTDYDCFTYIASDVGVSFDGPDSATVTWTEPSTDQSTISAYTVYMLDHDFQCEKSPCTIDTSALKIAPDALVIAHVVPIWDKYFALPLPVVPSDMTEVCTAGASAQELADALEAKDKAAAQAAFDRCPMDMTVSPLYKGFDQGSSALSQAVKLGYLDVVVELISYGANVNEQNSDMTEMTPLMETCFAPENQVEMTKALLNADADPQIRDGNGLSALNHANAEGSSEVADLLRAECAPGNSAYALADALKAKDEKAANIAFDGCPMDTTLAPLYEGFDQGSSALSYAVKLGYLGVVNELISYGADVNEQNADQNDKTPLIQACYAQKNQVEMVEALLTADADPQIRDGNGLSAHNHAYNEGSQEVADILRAECVAGASAKALAEALEAQDEKAAIIAFDGCPMDMTVDPLHKGFEEGYSALSYAVRLGYLDVVLELITHGADVDEQNRDQNDMTPLMQTCDAPKNQAEMAKALITAGADSQIRDINGQSALNLANSGGFTKVANILRAECVDGASAKALADALKAKDEKAANIAFDGCPMDTTVAPLHKGFVKNSSALSYAARQGYIDVVDELIFYGADVNEQNSDENDQTPLMQACYAPKNQAMMAKALLNVNADPQIRDSNSQTALEIAIEQGFTKAADILKAECVPGYSLHALEFAIKEGDKKGAITAFDGCPMDLTKSDVLLDAVKRKFIEVVKELIAYGADVNQYGNGKYNTLPLSTACEHGPELINILLAAGADPNKIGGEFMDYPSAYRCVEYNNADGLRALIAGGADMKATYRGRDQLYWAIHHKKTKAQKVIQDEVCVPGASLKDLEKALSDRNENRANNAFNGCPMDLTRSRVLENAIKLGYLNVVKQLIANGANVKASTGSYKTYFHYTCEATTNQASMISALRNAGADVNYLGGSSYSAAHHCIVKYNQDALKALVSRGANLKQVYNGRTVKEAAVAYNYQKVIDVVCTPGASFRELDSALKNRDQTRAELAFDGCPMNVKNSYAIHDAVERGYVKVTKNLISYGADANGFNHFYYTPLHWTCDAPSNNAELVKILVNAGADVNKLGTWGKDYSAAHRCAWRNEAGAMRELIDAGINLDIRHNDKTALMFANEYGSYSLKKMIQDEYCKKNDLEWEINYYLKRKDEYRAAKAFNGCPVDQYSSYLYRAFTGKYSQQSALYHAVELGYIDVVKGLIDAGVNVDERHPNSAARSPIYKTCGAPKNKAEMVKALAKGGADLDMQKKDRGRYGNIHHCTQGQQLDALQAMIDAGANVYLENAYGQTPYELATAKNKSKSIKLLQQNGIWS